MRNLFIGLMFVFLDFNLTLGNCVIGLIPDFIGYFFIVKGLKELERRSMHFSSVTPAANGMMIYSLVLYLLDFSTLSAGLGIWVTVLGMIAVTGGLYVSYYVVLGVRDLEKESGCNLEGDALFSRWKLMAVMNLAAVVLLWVPGINIICIILTFVTGVMFLVAFNKSSNAY